MAEPTPPLTPDVTPPIVVPDTPIGALVLQLLGMGGIMVTSFVLLVSLWKAHDFAGIFNYLHSSEAAPLLSGLSLAGIIGLRLWRTIRIHAERAKLVSWLPNRLARLKSQGK